jgi:hypothetical protein
LRRLVIFFLAAHFDGWCDCDELAVADSPAGGLDLPRH